MLNHENSERLPTLSQDDTNKLHAFAQEVYQRSSDTQTLYETAKEYIFGKLQRELAKINCIMQCFDQAAANAAEVA